MSTQTLPGALDLRQGYPRSPNEALGSYVLLPRIIDKCRATLAGSNGEYNYNCPLDRQFFDYTGVDAEAFKQQVAAGKTDEELLAWVQEHSSRKDKNAIRAWSYKQRWRRPEADEMIAFFESIRLQAAPNNYRIETWFQLLDADEGRF